MDWINIPNKYKPVPFWSWNEKLDVEEIKRQIEEFKDKGYGGHFMHSRVGLVTKYLSEEWIEFIKEGANKSRELGIDAWLYDEDKWPSGYAGGVVPLASDEYGSRNLLLLRFEELTEDDTVFDECDADGIHFYIAKRIEPHKYKEFGYTCYIDTMNPDAVSEFIRVTHDKYKQTVGEYFSDVIPGIFTDEPCYHLYNLTKVPSLPWSERLPEYFREKCGYSVLDNICGLFFPIGDYRNLRYDFFKCVSELFMESYTKQYSSWCRNNKIKMTGHYMCEDSIALQIQFIGHAMPHYVHMDIPGVDKLRRNIEHNVTLKQLTSVTDQFEKEQALCEIFGCIGHNASFFHRKWIADWAVALGISLINGHLALYSMRGERKRDYPSNLFYQQPWWEDEGEFSDYISRISYLASVGKSAAEVLVIHPIESGWCEYSAYNAKMMLPNGTEIYNSSFEKLTNELLSHHISFHYGDEEILAEYGRVEKGELVVGAMKYSCVIVPKCLTLRATTVSLLREFKGKIIGVASAPQLMDGKEAVYDIKMSKNFLKATEAAKWVCENVSRSITVTETRSKAIASSIRVLWRVDKNEEYIFLANINEKRDVCCTVRITTEKVPYIIDLNSGEKYAIEYARNNGAISFEILFSAAGSMAVGLEERGQERNKISYLKSGVIFGNTELGNNIKPVSVDVTDSNVMPLEYVDFEINGKLLFEREHISNVWHPHFYNAEEGTSFRVTYRFDVEKLPEGNIFAVVELAENLDLIELNGVEVKPLKKKGELGAYDKSKSWLDVGFTKIPIRHSIKLGENVLTIHGKKCNNIIGTGSHISIENFKEHYPTEAETAYIVGDFTVLNTDNRRFSISTNKSNGVNLTDAGYPFYAGKARFRFVYTCDAECVKMFKITKPNFASCKILVNNEHVDTICYEPYMFGARLKVGENIIEIEAATTLYNLMGPNWNANMPEAEFVGPNQFVDKNSFTEQLTLLPFGLDGIAEVVIW